MREYRRDAATTSQETAGAATTSEEEDGGKKKERNLKISRGREVDRSDGGGGGKGGGWDIASPSEAGVPKKPKRRGGRGNELIDRHLERIFASDGSSGDGDDSKKKKRKSKKNTKTTPPAPRRRNRAAAATAEDSDAIEPLKTFDLYASCLPGLEPVLYEELVEWGFRPGYVIEGGTSSVDEEEDATAAADEGGTTGRRGNESDEPTWGDENFRTIGRGGLTFSADSVDEILSAHLRLGSCGHVLLRAGEPFRAVRMDDLIDEVGRMDFWRRYILGPDFKDRKAKGEEFRMPKLDVRATCSKSRLMHTGAVAERVERGIRKSLRLDDVTDKKRRRNGPKRKKDSERAAADDDGTAAADAKEEGAEGDVLKVLVRIRRDEVQLSVDTSSTPMHRRGYRLETAKAPLREDLAYAMLRSAGWHAVVARARGEGKSAALLDPFCGSGTIPVEAALVACGLPPGRLRPAPLSGSSLCDAEAWERTVRAATAEVNPSLRGVSIAGSDRDGGAVEIARSNAERAGVRDLIQFRKMAIASHPWFNNPTGGCPPGTLLVATNPPFGKRVSPPKGGGGSQRRKGRKGPDPLLPLYQLLGHRINELARVREEGSSVRVAMLARDRDLARRTAMKGLRVRFAANHGGLPVSCFFKDFDKTK